MVDGCDQPQKVRRMCRLHYERTRLHGEPAYRGRHQRAERRVTEKGYILIFRPDHPNARADGYIFEHRLIVAESLGRALRDGEIVHHRNGIHDDNQLNNLQLTTSVEHGMNHSHEAVCPNCSHRFSVDSLNNTV